MSASLEQPATVAAAELPLEIHMCATLDSERAAEACVWVSALYAALGDMATGPVEIDTNLELPSPRTPQAAQRQLELHLLEKLRQARLAQYQLTAREQEVGNLVARGMSNGEIGEQLYIARSTVKEYLERLTKKLGVSNRTSVALMIGYLPS